MGALRMGLLAAAAAIASFALVTFVRSALQEPMAVAEQTAASEEEPVAPDQSSAAARPGQRAAPAAASAAGAARSKPAAVQVQQLPLPPGVVVSEGKGLLEVDTGDRHSIYVGGAFVGVGPIRRVELDQGSHQVRTRLRGDEGEHTVTISAGQRTRLGLAAGK
jgi:hypothetical protein